MTKAQVFSLQPDSPNLDGAQGDWPGPTRGTPLRRETMTGGEWFESAVGGAAALRANGEVGDGSLFAGAPPNRRGDSLGPNSPPRVYGVHPRADEGHGHGTLHNGRGVLGGFEETVDALAVAMGPEETTVVRHGERYERDCHRLQGIVEAPP